MKFIKKLCQIVCGYGHSLIHIFSLSWTLFMFPTKNCKLSGFLDPVVKGEDSCPEVLGLSPIIALFQKDVVGQLQNTTVVLRRSSRAGQHNIIFFFRKINLIVDFLCSEWQTRVLLSQFAVRFAVIFTINITVNNNANFSGSLLQCYHLINGPTLI